jgi:class 3 adenylate cyclase
VRTALNAQHGREVKHTGDGIMASFTSVSAAVASAIEIQRSLRNRNEDAVRPIRLRVGISVGEPVTEGGDLFGAAVQLSARLCAAASPGGIAVSTAVRELCVGKLFDFDSMGALDLKGFTDPVPAFEVRLPTE